MPGAEHRRQRKMLNSGFSTESMRSYLPMFYTISKKVSEHSPLDTTSILNLVQLKDILSESTKRDGHEIDVVHWVKRASVEFIAQAGLGYAFGEVDSRDNPSHPVVKAIDALL